MSSTPPAGPLPGAAVIGGGPAGLMAAEALLACGVPVDLFDAMPSVGRKFLLAGKGGLNLTHAEPFEPFVSRYRERAGALRPLLQGFGADQLRAWAAGLGISTFVGTSQRVFPQDLKAAPLLRAWLHRLRGQGLRVHARHRWLGWDESGALRFATPAGEQGHRAGVTVLALGGGSWPQLGSDGAWVPALRGAGAEVSDLLPSNCGFEVQAWSEHLRSRFAGAPLKTVGLQWTSADGAPHHRIGECVLTDLGLEGSLVYAASADLRQHLAAHGEVTVHLDLLPGRDLAAVQRELAHPRGARSMASHLQSRLKLAGVKAALLRELAPSEAYREPQRLAALIKSLPLRLVRTRPLPEAISTAGGVRFECLTPDLMLRSRPGVFVAGEMLDWEAPTGGYLLTACWATGDHAGRGAAQWWQGQNTGLAGGAP
jgi:uncharacterized flavoprotein (TIGR03862 family)